MTFIQFIITLPLKYLWPKAHKNTGLPRPMCSIEIFLPQLYFIMSNSFKLLALLGFTFVSFFGAFTEGSANSPKTSKYIITEDSLSVPAKFSDNLDPLIEYFGTQGFDINALVQDQRFEIYENIADRFQYSAEKKSHSMESYKKVLGFQAKSNNIVNFINKHSEKLKEAEETYGIPRYIISAIIGIESDFGKNIGSYNPFNAYVSMYVNDYRKEFAKDQIEQLLIFAKDRNLDIFEMKSSYAGAMTFAQFIPYSLNKWWVGDELFNMDNNILSVANYLSYFQERTGSVETAVFRYNPSDLYTQAVLDLAKEAENHFSTVQKVQ